MSGQLTENMSTNPYLLPNFHTMTEKCASLEAKHNRFCLTSQLDFNGSGVFSQTIAAKNNRIANFHALSPSLPYFIDKTREKYKFCAKNCLIRCRTTTGRQLLVSTTRNQINCLAIEEKVLTDNESNEQNNSHIYSSDKRVSYGPFRCPTRYVCPLYESEEQDFRPIFELKTFNKTDENETQIQTNSRNRIKFFGFRGESISGQELSIGFESLSELNVQNVGRSEESMFENCERNALLDNRLLLSYTSDDVIDLYDFESQSIVRSFDSNYMRLKSDKQIGLKWCENNEMLFFYGQHQKIVYCDSRAHRPAIQLFANKENANLFDWELFYDFLPTKLNTNQLFLATDYHILVTDLRFPNKSLIQLKHLIPKTIIRSLRSLVVEDCNHSKTELLVSSNLNRNCLMSFNRIPNQIPLSSLHLPLHLSIPKDIDRQFENCFYRGIELIDSPNNSGFSLALLTNFGDIFVQDLYWISSEDSNASEKDRSFSAGVGSSNLGLDYKSAQYMNVINNYLIELKIEKTIETVYTKQCLNCSVNRVCKQNQLKECLCRNPNASAKEYNTGAQHKTPNSSELLANIYSKYLGEDMMKIKAKLENKQQLFENTNKYTKKVLKIWDLIDDSTHRSQADGPSEMDINSASTSKR